MSTEQSPESDSLFRAHYISGTHWDREWYRPFQEFRVLLVRLIDELLDLVEENEEFRYFQLDGQTCVLEDYLEIRPENRERLARLIREGRILIGPWFTMPDLFCPGQESLVRNLLMGRTVAGEWDADPMPVAYTCDMFGHPAQMPQIYAGFDLRNCVLGRGTNEHTTPPFFHWEAPDGSKVFTFKLQDGMGYGAFSRPRQVLEQTEDFAHHTPEFADELEGAGDDREKRREVKEKWFRRALSDYVEHEIDRSNAPVLCLMDALDHVLPATEVSRYLRLIGEACPEVEPLHSNLPAFFEEARRETGGIPAKTGELREPSRERCGYLWLIANCVSARVRMKQANDACEAILQRWAEPLTALANLDAKAVPRRFLRVAWEHLLLNHAHDSICGCSIDQVHRDMMHRYDQARELADQVRHQATAALTERCRELGREDDEFTVVLVNPLPRERSEVVEFDIDLPPDYPAEFKDGFDTQAIKAFRLEDAEGDEVPYQRLSFEPGRRERSDLARFCFQHDGEFIRYRVAAQVDLPALGFTSLRVVPSDTPVRRCGSLRTGPRSAENEHLAIEIQPGGTLALTDKTTGEQYTDLLMLEDRTEVGDGWFHGHSINDEQFLSAANEAQVSVVEDGPEQVTFRSTVWLAVPERYEWRSERPSEQTTRLKVSHLVTLRRGARVIDVQTVVDNTAEDHRLRLLLPTDCEEADTCLAHTPYHVTEREIALDSETTSWQEMEQAEKPFRGFQAVGTDGRGLAFISEGGLHEGGVMDDRRRTMQVTLLRSFRKTVGTDGERDGLERGRIEYRYALLPYAGLLPETEVIGEMDRLQSGLLTRQSGPRPSGYPPLDQDGTASLSFVRQVDETLAISAIKPGRDGEGLVIRLWNPAGETRRETLRFFRPVAEATKLKLSEETASDQTGVEVHGREVTVQAGGWEIVTVGVKVG